MGAERGGWASPRFLAEPRNDMVRAGPRNDTGKRGAFGWHGVRERGIEGHMGGITRHNDSVSRLGGGGGAGAWVEAEGNDEEAAGSCADCGEDARPFKAAEERTYDRADGSGDGGD